MFRRLFLTFGLLTLALMGALVPAIVLTVEPSEARDELLLRVGGVALMGLAALLLLSRRLAGEVTRPVRDLTLAADRMGAGAGGPRVFVTSGDELRRLADAFNAMSEKLGRQIAELEQDRQQLRTVLSGMVEGVVALDAGQRILFVNERAAGLLELPAGSPVGRPLWEVVRHRALLDVVRAALEDPGPQRAEVHWNGRDPRSLTVHAARLPGMPPRGAVLVLHDTTELRRLERLRHEFVANVSHELKTPLAVIKACAETLADGAVDDVANRDQFLGQILRQGDRLDALIMDLLSLARIESGEEVFRFGAVAVGPAVSACLERHRPRAEVRRQTLEAAEGPPAAVWVDPDALEQMLENLLDNAVKYTPEGGRVRVGWRVEEGHALIEVSDTGIGIPEADLPRIFERFYRVEKARSRELGGTGLGLAIVKHLSQAMNGSVRAASRLGEGSTFTLCLPLARGQALAAGASPAEAAVTR